jgi:hypothetical protein
MGTTAISRMQKRDYTVNENDCHIWNGSVNGEGYGTIQEANGSTTLVHILSWVAAHGERPTKKPTDGSRRWEVHHLCKNKLCINSAHLVLLSAKPHSFVHRATAPKCPLKRVPRAECLTWPGFLWHRIEGKKGCHGPVWGWSVEL